jgi:hypothetical protein
MADVQIAGYPIVEDVMQLARTAINDMTRDTAGRILTDTNPATLVYLNASIRRTQRELANNGITTNIRDNVVVSGLTPAGASDPSVQVTLNKQGYFDGAVTHAQPVLPADLIFPLEVWERVTGSAGQFIFMPHVQESLESRLPGSYFGEWEWREEQINLTGSTQTEDLRLRYEASAAVLGLGINFNTTTIRIADGLDVLAAGIVYQYAFTRGSAMRQEALQMWQHEADVLINRYVRKDQRVMYRPRGFRAGAGRIDGALQGTIK